MSAMNNQTRTESINQGFDLGHQLSKTTDRVAHKPIPTPWVTELDNYPTIAGVVNAVPGFGPESDRVIRFLMATPTGDETATLVIVRGLLPTLIHKHRGQPHRIADVIIELSLLVSQRPRMGGRRHAIHILLDEATNREQRNTHRHLDYYENHEPMPEDAVFVDGQDCEATAIASIQFDQFRIRLAAANHRVNFDTLIYDGTRSGLNQMDRQRLSRDRKRVRAMVAHELAEVA